MPFTLTRPLRIPSVVLHAGLLLIYHLTPFAVPLEKATVNSCCWPAITVAVAGVIPVIVAGGSIVKFAVPVRVVCAWATPVITTTFFEGGAAGAVYFPLVSIEPVVWRSPPITPFTSQFARVLLKFEIVAVNCTVPLTFTVLAEPKTEIVGVDAVAVLPQELSAASAGKETRSAKNFCQRIFFRKDLSILRSDLRSDTRNPPAQRYDNLF